MDGLIVVLVCLLILVGVIYGLYTRTGSGIERRPWGGERGAAGAEGDEEIGAPGEDEASSLDQRGTGNSK